MKKLNGIQLAALGALEAGIRVAAGYPGGPVTGVIHSLAEAKRDGNAEDLHVEWSPNEKDAFSTAFGAAMVGQRALAAVKHVGANVAADAIMAAAFSGVRGGLVIALGSDPGGKVSQNEMDERHFAPLFELPMIEPSTPEQARSMARYAFELSETCGTVVLLRLSSVFLTRSEIGETGEAGPADIGTQDGKADGQPGGTLPITIEDRGLFIPRREQLSLGSFILEASRGRNERLAHAKKELETFPFNIIEGDEGAPFGIITTGPTVTKVRDSLMHAAGKFRILCLGVIYPFPESVISRFAEGLEGILVVEELSPFMEEKLLNLRVPVRGKLTGDLPREGALDAKDIGIAIERFLGDDTPVRSFDVRNREHLSTGKAVRWAEGCPVKAGHEALRQALDRMKKPLCIGGVGVVSWGGREPFENLASFCCMGISPSVAAGIYHAGSQYEEIIAVMGDSSFCHSGIQSLMNAVYNRAEITFIIFDNHITAETGRQPNPATGVTITGEDTVTVSLDKLVAACGVESLFKADPFDTHNSRNAILEAVKTEGVSVVLLSAPCPPSCCTG